MNLREYLQHQSHYYLPQLRQGRRCIARSRWWWWFQTYTQRRRNRIRRQKWNTIPKQCIFEFRQCRYRKTRFRTKNKPVYGWSDRLYRSFLTRCIRRNVPFERIRIIVGFTIIVGGVFCVMELPIRSASSSRSIIA